MAGMPAACDRVVTCPLFARFSVGAALGVWKTYYCEGEFTRCERWKMAQAGREVPTNLLPNGRMLQVPLERIEPRDLS